MQNQLATQPHWLRSYYFSRATFSIAWVIAAVSLGAQAGPAAVLLVIYPAWDALANLTDARVNGGLRANPAQALNVAVSTIATLAVVIALGNGMHSVLAVVGVWAVLAGVLQLAAGVRRWRLYGAQWAMILSGAQSALAGAFMVSRSLGAVVPTLLDIAPYVGFGAFYFLVSAIWLVFIGYRRGSGLGAAILHAPGARPEAAGLDARNRVLDPRVEPEDDAREKGAGVAGNAVLAPGQASQPPRVSLGLTRGSSRPRSGAGA